MGKQLLCNSPTGISVMMTYLKSDFLKNIGGWFNQWARSSTHPSINFQALNVNIREVERIHKRHLDLKAVMSSSDVQTCGSVTRQAPDNMSNDLGSMLDNVEMANELGFDLNGELKLSKSRDSSFVGGPLNFEGQESLRDLSIWQLDLSKTLSQNSFMKKDDLI